MSGDGSDRTWQSSDRPGAENAALVEAIVAGDREAECEFVARYQPRLRALLLARTRNHDAAADLMQDVIVEAICALRRGQLREPCKLTPFVLGIARNLLLGHFRNAARQPEPIEMPDHLPDLRAHFFASEDHREATAMAAIASLDPIDRSILQWTLVDGMKPGAIAEKLNMSSEVVRQRKLRATRKVIDLVRSQSQKLSRIHIVSGRKL